MIHVLRFLSVLFFVFCYSLILSAQITITQSDVNTNFINQRWVQVSDTTTDTLILGSPSSSPQVFDVSNIIIAPATARFDTAQYLNPSGHVGAASYPTATVCTSYSIDSLFLGFTVTQTFAEYYHSQSDGVYDLGYAMRTQITPTPPPPFPADTTVEYFHTPQQLIFPLPLTLGTTRTVTDSIVTSNSTIITQASFTADGFGTVIFPGGQSMSAIRVVHDEVVTIKESGNIIREPMERHIEFYAQDLTQISIGVDTTVTGDTLPGIDYRISKKYVPTGVSGRNSVLPAAFSLSQNYPNPFNPSTTISFELPERSFVGIKIFDLLGREITTLLSQDLNAGRHEVQWNASQQPSGVYYYRIQAGNFTQIRKLLLLK